MSFHLRFEAHRHADLPTPGIHIRFPTSREELFAPLRSTFPLSAFYRVLQLVFQPRGFLRLLWPLYSGFLSPTVV